MQPLTHVPFKQLQNWQLHTTSIPNLANQIKSITSQLLQYRNKTSDKYIQLKTVLKTEIKISYRNNRGICFNLCCIQALYLETSSSISLLSHRSFFKKNSSSSSKTMIQYTSNRNKFCYYPITTPKINHIFCWLQQETMFIHEQMIIPCCHILSKPHLGSGSAKCVSFVKNNLESTASMRLA